MLFFEILRPSECPNCGRKHPLRKHGTYSRHVYCLFFAPVLINVLRYYCPSCGITVNVLPSFCLPRKRYSAGTVSLCLQLVLACGVSLRAANKAYPAVSRVLAGVWLKQWYLSSNGIISLLRNHFGFTTTSAELCTGHNSSYITPECLEAFFGSCDFALGYEIISCHGECGISGTVECEKRECSGILKTLQERFSVLSFPVRLF